MFNALNYAILKTQLQQIAAQGANRSMLWRKTASGNPVSVYPVPESPMYPKISGTFSQSGTGDPSPSNIRPITPWLANGASVSVVQTDGDTIALTAPQEIAAGWMDNEGNGQKTWVKKVFDGTEPAWIDLGAKNATHVFFIPLADKKYGSGLNSSKCSHFNNTHVMVDLDTLSADGLFSDYWWDAHLYFCYGTNATSLADFKAFLSAQYAAGTPVTICYELATPVPITPAIAPLSALPQIDRATPRANVLTASTGQIELTYAKSPIRESDDIAAAIAAL